ncbi:MAG: RNA 2',3'-cyclic phosphodiesterase [Planctomycetota bacterium]
MKRLFFGLGVDPAVGDRVVRSVHHTLDGEGEFAVYAAEDLHVTLVFLGAVDEAQVPEIVRTATQEFRALAAPELRLGGCADAFPSRDRPRALFAGVRESMETSGRLDVLRNRALQVGLSHGWRPSREERSRAYRPHVTVARPRNGSRVPEEFWDLDAERRWVPVDVVLYESLAQREGEEPRYRVLASWPLAVQPG